MRKLHPFSVIIPAAGHSQRMGKEKSLLKDHSGNSFVEGLCSAYHASRAHPVIIVLNDSFDITAVDLTNSVILINDRVELGRTWSIRLGLQHVPDGNSCFIHNVDNPYYDPELIKVMLDVAEVDSVVITAFRGKGGHPVLLGPEVVNNLKTRELAGDFRKYLHEFRKIGVPWEDSRILLNINYPGDYRDYLSGS
jgi:CTP:molybdopterin cytidylyltransferase MocA